MPSKKRLCIALPSALYDKLEKDSAEYGIPKASIISMLLVDYYKTNDNVALAKSDNA